MKRRFSLRARLTLIILPPVLAVAMLSGMWQLNNARQTADNVFNKSLLAAAVAVANDVAISGGDALSLRTRDILASTSGGLVFYHVYAPDGVIVAGYATPPVGIDRTGVEATDPTYFAARYLGRDVRGVRLQTQTEIDGLPGLYTTTVWQDSQVRAAFVRDLVLQSLSVLGSICAALALIVWFGVRLGLRPLLDLEEAIARRSIEDLSPIRRAVPIEVTGVVGTLNRLFDQVTQSLQAQSDFIANAAHQLRNPIAGVLSLAEAVGSAKKPEQIDGRVADLISAARDTADLSQKLLMLERAQSMSFSFKLEALELNQALRQWFETDTARASERPRVRVVPASKPIEIKADPVMLREAFVNLIDNALIHGGPELSEISISVEETGDTVIVTVQDDGIGIPDSEIGRAFERFVQLGETGKSGLGLPIAAAIAHGHDGQISISCNDIGLAVSIELPKLQAISGQ